MVVFLVLQIQMGNITIDDVPMKYRDEVLKKLNNNN